MNYIPPPPFSVLLSALFPEAAAGMVMLILGLLLEQETAAAKF